MKLAFSKPTATAEEQQALFATFRPVGYEGLQLKHGQYRDLIDTPERFAETWRDTPGAGAALILGGKLDDAGIANLRALFRFAQVVGTERIVFCHGEPRASLSDDDIRGFARTLGELGKEAIAHGTKLSLHHHYNQPVMHRPDFDVFFDAVEPGTVGLTVDTAHLVKSGIDDVAGIVRDFASVIDNVHLKDYADGEWRVLGQGDIDFVPIFAAFHSTGYDGWFSADEESGSELRGAMQACYDYMVAGLAAHA